jgi:hypothetical protein
MDYLCVSDAARRLGAKPKDISDLFYRRTLRDDLCPIVAGRRLIPENYLDIIAQALKRARRPVGDSMKKGVDRE